MKAGELIEHVVNLFYPKLCLACECENYSGTIPVCVSCLAELPLTNMHNQQENLITERLLGRINLHSAAALFYFTKKSKVQHLVHQVKYSGDPTIANMLGHWMGRYLSKSDLFNQIDMIVPVPLHKDKLQKRGYNQSAEFGKGLADILGSPCLPDALRRTKQSVSQTTGIRTARLLNVHESFSLNTGIDLSGKHILLVDDVLTTGATIEACATKILALPDTKISICVMAIVMD